MDFSAVDFSLSGKFATMHPSYPIIESNFITVGGNDKHGEGSRSSYRLHHIRSPVSDINEEEALCGEEKLVVKLAAPELPPVDIKGAKFPYCLVWVPLPVVAWLVPFVGHVGICREDGVILDFAGNININHFAFGAAAKFVRLSQELCCFPQHSSKHTCKDSNAHSASGTAISWDDAILRTVEVFGNKQYNFFTCNCHSFVANCMNRMAYAGSTKWNLVTVLLMAIFRGTFVNFSGILRAYVPFLVVMALGLYMAGWAFFFFWCGFTLLLLGWFTFGTYAFGGIIDC